MSNLAHLEFHRVTTIDDLDELRRWLGERRPILSIDIETEGLNVGCDKTRLFQFGDNRRGFALDYTDWKGAVRELVHAYDRPMVAHNLLFETKMLKRDGIILPQKLMHDSMIMAFLHNPAVRMDLKGAAKKYVDSKADAGKGLLEETMAKNNWTWATIPTDNPVYWQYGVLDTCLSAMLAEKLWPEIRTKYRYAYELELAFIHVLREAELAGMLVDEDARRRTADKLQSEIDALTFTLASNGLEKPGSDREVIKFLRSRGAGEYLVFKTDRGNTSVDKHALKWVAQNGFPIATVVSDWRNRTRMLGNYIEKFAEVRDGGLAVDGVLRASTRPVAARTGRTSITDPPLQTLPRGRVVRDCIVARPGHRFCMADFAGMEMRGLASLANETALLQAFDEGIDPHGFVAKELYGPNYTKQQRSTCKNAGFAKIYGAGLLQFAATAEISVPEAQEFLNMYDERFPRVQMFMDEMINDVRERAQGRWSYVELQDGRRLPVELDKAYVAVNYRIQGGMAVSAKEKLVELDNAGLGEYFRLFVHDEFIFEVPDEIAPEVNEVIRTTMPDRHSWPGVTLEIDQDEVDRWGQHYRGDYQSYVDTPDPEWLEVAA